MRGRGECALEGRGSEGCDWRGGQECVVRALGGGAGEFGGEGETWGGGQ